MIRRDRLEVIDNEVLTSELEIDANQVAAVGGIGRLFGTENVPRDGLVQPPQPLQGGGEVLIGL